MGLLLKLQPPVQSRFLASPKVGTLCLNKKFESATKRSLALLPQAVEFANRAFIFDNSCYAGNHILVAEVTHGKEIEMKTNLMPY